MLNDYIPIIHGELLFGYVYRYHIYSGNLSFFDTARDIWNDRNKWVYSVLFPYITDEILSELKMTKDEYIFNHTVLPFYMTFVNKKKNTMILQDIYFNNTYSAHLVIKGRR